MNISNESVNLPDGWHLNATWGGYKLILFDSQGNEIKKIRTINGIKCLACKVKVLIKEKKIINVDFD